MLLTVGICTWRRAPLLARTLRSLAAASLPAHVDWEVLVVDNGGDGATAKVIAELARRLPLRCVREPTLGLSHARNRCVAEARGDYLVWTDDDVIVSPRWLGAYIAAFAREPDAAFFGGPITPCFEGSPPEWLRLSLRQVSGAYALRDLGASAKPIAGERDLPYGANYAVRMREQRLHRYDPRLGRSGAVLFGGEELAVLSAIMRDGGRGWWVPEAGLEHWIPRERQTLRFVSRYYRHQGRQQALSRTSKAPARTFFDRPLWLWRRVATLHAQSLRDVALHGPERWVAQLARARTAWGLFEAWPGGAR